jgi:hypothetical protein
MGRATAERATGSGGASRRVGSGDRTCPTAARRSPARRNAARRGETVAQRGGNPPTATQPTVRTRTRFRPPSGPLGPATTRTPSTHSACHPVHRGWNRNRHPMNYGCSSRDRTRTRRPGGAGRSIWAPRAISPEGRASKRPLIRRSPAPRRRLRATVFRRARTVDDPRRIVARLHHGVRPALGRRPVRRLGRHRNRPPALPEPNARPAGGGAA